MRPRRHHIIPSPAEAALGTLAGALILLALAILGVVPCFPMR